MNGTWLRCMPDAEEKTSNQPESPSSESLDLGILLYQEHWTNDDTDCRHRSLGRYFIFLPVA